MNFHADIRSPPMDNHILSYGRFATWTYDEVYRLHPEYCKWTLETARIDRGGSDSTPQLQHFALYLYRKQFRREPPRFGIDGLNIDFRPAEERHQPPNSVPARPKAPSQEPPRPKPSSKASSSKSGGPAVEVHLPTADRRLEQKKFEGIPESESSTDRRRIFAATGAVHDASGDTAMEPSGNGDWVFPLEPSPQPFTG